MLQDTINHWLINRKVEVTRSRNLSAARMLSFNSEWSTFLIFFLWKKRSDFNVFYFRVHWERSGRKAGGQTDRETDRRTNLQVHWTCTSPGSLARSVPCQTGNGRPWHFRSTGWRQSASVDHSKRRVAVTEADCRRISDISYITNVTQFCFILCFLYITVYFTNFATMGDQHWWVFTFLATRLCYCAIVLQLCVVVMAK